MQSKNGIRGLKLVTTSWDDGHPNDLRIAELLRARNLCGTFYVPITAPDGRQRLSERDLRDMHSAGFEIGGHSISHKELSRLSQQEVADEVGGCKKILEDAIDGSVEMFCYPKGRYNEVVIQELEAAGFRGARTTRMLSMATDFDCFEMPTTLQAFSHSTMTYIRNQGRAKSIPGLVTYFTRLKKLERWVDAGMELFDDVLAHGGIWHLYGHSWEIEQLGRWDELREMFDYISNREGVTYATNIQTVMLASGPQSHSASAVFA